MRSCLSQCAQSVLRALASVNAYVPVFGAFNKFIIGWQVLRITFVLAFLILVPLEYSFLSHEAWFTRPTNCAFLLFFLLDIFITINTSIYHEGVAMKDRLFLARSYFK